MIKQLSFKERKTFGLHLSYSVIEGIIRGVLILNEFVLIKTLNGSDYQIAYLLQFQHMVLIFSVVFNEFLRRTSKKRRMVNRVALYTRLPLLAMAFFPSVDGFIPPVFHFIFLSVFLIYYLATPLVFPTINLLLKNSYTHENFGKYYSYAQSVTKL